jgi:hypothetical protein
MHMSQTLTKLADDIEHLAAGGTLIPLSGSDLLDTCKQAEFSVRMMPGAISRRTDRPPPELACYLFDHWHLIVAGLRAAAFLSSKK